MSNSERNQPDGSAIDSFTSGNTTPALIIAQFSNKKFGDKNPWGKDRSYTLINFTGTSRVLNNRFCLSHILNGVGIGILSVDLTHFPHKNNKSRKNKATPVVFSQSTRIYLRLCI
ncbi:MAG: hypothetical protein ACEPOZ_02815 [Marinifilaceae bacterium]